MVAFSIIVYVDIYRWKNVDRDVLQCVGCNAFVAVILNSQLSAQGTLKLTAWYESQLAHAHQVSCPFRRLAQEYFGLTTEHISDNRQSPPPTTTPIPNETRRESKIQPRAVSSFVMLASVLPPVEVELLEHPKPIHLLQTFVKQLVVLPQSEKLERYKENLPSHVALALGLSTTKTAGSNESPNSVLTQLFDILFPDRHQEPNTAMSETTWETCLLLTLLGWRVQTDQLRDEKEGTEQPNSLGGTSTQTQSQRFWLQCPLCLATLTVPENDNDNDSGTTVTAKETTTNTTSTDADQNSTGTATVARGPNDKEEAMPEHKRARTVTRCNPCRAHRYYCPYQCGFPQNSGGMETGNKNLPVWQELVNKFSLASTEKTMDNENENTPQKEKAVESPSNDEEQPSAWMRVHQMLLGGLAARPHAPRGKIALSHGS